MRTTPTLRFASRVCAFSAALALAACSDNPSTGSPAYKEGELGNGAFLFACDDSVACDRWTTNSAKDFPTEIATGSNFNLRFVANEDQGHNGTFRINDKEYTGVTAAAIGPYVSSGPNGFAALSPGYGTVIAHDHAGFIVDYVTLKIVQPDGLVVYKSDYKGSDPPQVQSITTSPNQAQSYRVVGKHGGQAIAGSITIDWTSDDTGVLQIESYSRGVVNIIGKTTGKTKLRAAGAAMTKEIDVEVKP